MLTHIYTGCPIILGRPALLTYMSKTAAPPRAKEGKEQVLRLPIGSKDWTVRSFQKDAIQSLTKAYKDLAKRDLAAGGITDGIT